VTPSAAPGAPPIEELTRELDEARAAMHRLQALLESTDQGIYWVDARARCTFINRAGAEFLGWNASDLLGVDLHAVMHHHRRDGSAYPADSCPNHQALRTGRGVRVTDEVFWRKDGRPFDVEYSAHPVWADGTLTGAVVTFSDVTERRRLEDQLRMSQKLEAIGQLAGGIAHDFNNLLTVINGYTEMLLGEHVHDAASSELLREIAGAGARAADLTRRLLIFGRKQEVARRPLKLDQVVDDIAVMLRRLIGENVALSVDHAANLPVISADAGMLEQIVVNLAINARDAMPAGGRLSITTSLETVSAAHLRASGRGRPGTFVRLAVADTGTGIPADVLPRIFEPFFTTKPVERGTGLGLATVFGIVEQHEGWITVDTAVGRGTRFDVFLPVLPSVAAVVADAQAPTAAHGGTETILLVDDEASVQRLVGSTLRRHGYRVLEASSSGAALEIWRDQAARIDLLFTDIMMRDGTGIELAGALRRERADLPVIYSSGYAFDLDADPYGHVLPKPYALTQLTSLVRRVLDRTSPRSERDI
jgi:two-component system, cell cycle sensor histidine kinase and response regulator CckA